jgi:exodeoxyribonuclease VIII
MTTEYHAGTDAIVVHDMPDAVYHQVEAFSSSATAKLLDSQEKYLYERTQPRSPSPAMLLGTIVHSAILEPDTMSRYFPLPDIKANTKAGKEELERLITEAQANNLRPVPAAMLDKARDMQKRVLNYRSARLLLDGAQSEVSVFWHDPENDIRCKARLDGLASNGGVFDIKTTQNAGADAFGRSCHTYLYHAQAAQYMEAATFVLETPARYFAWIAVESEPPHGVAVYVAQPHHLRAGLAKIVEARRIYADLQRRVRDKLPPLGYPDEFQPLQMPAWAMKEYA